MPLTDDEKRLIEAMRAASGGPLQSVENQLFEAMTAASRQPNRRTWRRVRAAMRTYWQDFERAQRVASIRSTLERLELAWIRGIASDEGYTKERARLIAKLSEQDDSMPLPWDGYCVGPAPASFKRTHG
jgi:hypothetical protein